MHSVRYLDFIPGGNKTALVIGDQYSADEKKRINDAIMAADPEIEQVGFVKSTDDDRPSLQMAGGEFCGNASRSAAFYYLDGQPGELTMTVSGDSQVHCGVLENGDAWCQIPLNENAGPQVENIAPGIHKVSLSGITHLVLEPDTATKHLQDTADIKAEGLTLIEKYGLENEEAAGAIFMERLDNSRTMIHPVVRVRDIGSLFYETACGSGTVAAAMVMAQAAGSDISAEIVQPSGMNIRADITLTAGDSSLKRVSRAVISGQVKTDLAVHTAAI